VEQLAGAVAQSLLSSAIDEANPDVWNTGALQDRLQGALPRAKFGREQAAGGETISIDEL
jgi:hypothetical protein